MLSRQDIIDTLKSAKPEFKKLGVVQIGLFGSYVRDEQQEDSDIDILIDFTPEQEKFDNFMQVYLFLEEAFKDKKVEVVTRNGLSPYIGPRILNEVEYF